MAAPVVQPELICPRMSRPDLERHFHRHDRIGIILAWIASPGYVVVTKLRFAKYLWSNQTRWGKLLGRLVWRNIVNQHGCHISLHASVGPGLRLPHPVAIVIGDDCVIGSNVTLYQNVTLGQRRDDIPGGPRIEDNVTIYAGAVVAGSITIGRGASIAANALVLEDVRPGERVGGNPARPLGPAMPKIKRATVYDQQPY